VLINRRFLLKASASAVAVSLFGRIGYTGAAEHLFLYDSHCHVMGSDQVRFPHVKSSAPAPSAGSGSQRPPGVRFGQIKKEPTIAKVLEWMEQNDVIAGAAVQHKGTYGFDNSFVLSAADTVSEKFIAVTVIDPTDPATPNMIRQFRQQHNFAGIRMTGAQGEAASYDWLVSDNAQKTWEVANELELSVDLMGVAPGYSSRTNALYLQMAKKFPNARLILNHIAWPELSAENYGINDELKSLSKLGNVYFKFTTINLDMLDEAEVSSSEFLRITLDALGAERIMWGSDIGNSAGTYAQMVERMLAAAESLSAEEKQWVLSDSARTAYRDFS